MSSLLRAMSGSYQFTKSSLQDTLGECLNKISLKRNGTSCFSPGRFHSSSTTDRAIAAYSNHRDSDQVVWSLSWSSMKSRIDNGLKDQVYDSLMQDCDPVRLNNSLLELNLEDRGLYCNTFCPGPLASIGSDGYFKMTSDMDGNFCTAMEFYLLKEALTDTLKTLFKDDVFGESFGMNEFRAADVKSIIERISNNVENSLRVVRAIVSIVSIFVPGLSVLNAVCDVIDVARLFLDVPLSSSACKPSPVSELVSKGTAGRIDGVQERTVSISNKGTVEKTVGDGSSRGSSDLKDYLRRTCIEIPSLTGKSFNVDICGTIVRAIVTGGTLGRYNLKVKANNRGFNNSERVIYSKHGVSSERILRVFLYLVISKFHKTMGLSENLRQRVLPEVFSRPRYRYDPSKNSLHDVEDSDIDGGGLCYDAHSLSLKDSVERILTSGSNKYIGYQSIGGGSRIYFYGVLDQISFYFPGMEDVAREIFKRVGVVTEEKINEVIKRKFYLGIDCEATRCKKMRYCTDINYLMLCCGNPRVHRVSNRIPVSYYVMRMIESRGTCVNPENSGAESSKYRCLSRLPKTFEKLRESMPKPNPSTKEEIRDRFISAIDTSSFGGGLSVEEKKDAENEIEKNRILNQCYQLKFDIADGFRGLGEKDTAISNPEIQRTAIKLDCTLGKVGENIKKVFNDNLNLKLIDKVKNKMKAELHKKISENNFFINPGNFSLNHRYFMCYVKNYLKCLCSFDKRFDLYSTRDIKRSSVKGLFYKNSGLKLGKYARVTQDFYLGFKNEKESEAKKIIQEIKELSIHILSKKRVYIREIETIETEVKEEIKESIIDYPNYNVVPEEVIDRAHCDFLSICDYLPKGISPEMKLIWGKKVKENKKMSQIMLYRKATEFCKRQNIYFLKDIEIFFNYINGKFYGSKLKFSKYREILNQEIFTGLLKCVDVINRGPKPEGLQKNEDNRKMEEEGEIEGSKRNERILKEELECLRIEKVMRLEFLIDELMELVSDVIQACKNSQ